MAARESSARPAGAAPDAIPVMHLVYRLDTGGLERMLLRLLAHTDRARFAPTVVALDAPGVLAPELEPLGIPLRVIRRREKGFDLRLPVELAAFMRREGTRIVHTHNAAPQMYGALAAQLARLRSGGPGPRVIHTKHGRNEPHVRRLVLFNRVASAISDRVVAVGEDTHAVAVGIERVDPRKVVTILNGIDTNEYRPGGDRQAARAELGAPPGGFHVGCVARLAAVKDHATLLEAFARFRATREDAHLTLVGDGDERRALEARAARLGVTGAVTFAGERHKVAPLLPAFDVFALSSTSEGISLTLLEAASVGLPIVATRVGGNAEIVADGETGLLVPPSDPAALAHALGTVASSADRGAMGAAGRARVVRRFSVERMARAYHDLYAEVLEIR
jgi:sugar transferase (PEP-CTERM/EpsH1 system associated)